MDISEAFQLEYFITHQLRHGTDPLDEYEALLEQCESIDVVDCDISENVQEATAHKHIIKDNLKKVELAPVLCLYIIDSNIYSK